MWNKSEKYLAFAVLFNIQAHVMEPSVVAIASAVVGLVYCCAAIYQIFKEKKE